MRTSNLPELRIPVVNYSQNVPEPTDVSSQPGQVVPQQDQPSVKAGNGDSRVSVFHVGSWSTTTKGIIATVLGLAGFAAYLNAFGLPLDPQGAMTGASQIVHFLTNVVTDRAFLELAGLLVVIGSAVINLRSVTPQAPEDRSNIQAGNGQLFQTKDGYVKFMGGDKQEVNAVEQKPGYFRRLTDHLPTRIATKALLLSVVAQAGYLSYLQQPYTLFSLTPSLFTNRSIFLAYPLTLAVMGLAYAWAQYKKGNEQAKQQIGEQALQDLQKNRLQLEEEAYNEVYKQVENKVFTQAQVGTETDIGTAFQKVAAALLAELDRLSKENKTIYSEYDRLKGEYQQLEDKFQQLQQATALAQGQ